ncbi:MAG: hypothetical protein JXR95_07005 [Deltaproteobacteria bacterium]|nr:hypothetical protein [Deltaproteobacteria bacterium]
MKIKPLMICIILNALYIPAQGFSKGRYDDFSVLSRFGINMKGRNYLTGMDDSQRMFTVVVSGKPDSGLLTDEMDNRIGTLDVIPEVGPITRLEFILKSSGTVVKERFTNGELVLEFGIKRLEKKLMEYAKNSLARSFPDMPEIKMQPYQSVIQMIELEAYMDALKTLQALPIGHGNGLRGLLIGDLNLVTGRIATAKRSYSGVIKRFGNYFFSSICKARLIAIRGMTEPGYSVELSVFDSQLSTLKPTAMQDFARLEFANALILNNYNRETLKVLVSMTGKEVDSYRIQTAGTQTRLYHAAKHYAMLALFCSHNISQLKKHPRRTEMILKCSHGLIESGQSSQAIALLQDEIKYHGKWKKNDVRAEKLYYLLTRAYYEGKKYFKAEASARFYLENKGGDAPREDKIWEIFGKILYSRNRINASATVFSTSIKKSWHTDTLAVLAHGFLSFFIRKNHSDGVQKISEALLSRKNSGDEVEEIILRAAKILGKNDFLERAISLMEKVRNPGGRFLYETGKNFQKIGDTLNYLLYMEDAVLSGGKWAGMAERNLRVFEMRKQY